MKYKTNKLRGRITEVYGTLYKFAGAIGLSTTSLNNKLQGRTTIKQEEIAEWASLLNIPLGEIGLYFFDREVPESGTEAVG